MSAPAFQCAARSLSLPERAPHRASRDIRYIFLESCRNIPASHARDAAGTVPRGPASRRPAVPRYLGTDGDRNSSLPRNLPSFFHALSTRVEAEAMDVRCSPGSNKRLPVFRRLCGEAVEELKKFPDAKAATENTKGWRIRQAAACSTCNKGMN